MWPISTLAVLVACVPPSQGDHRPTDEPSSQAEDRSLVEPVHAAVPPPNPPAAQVLQQDSQMPRARSVVDPTAEAGLRELAKELPREGLLWIGKLGGNGDRDVVIFIPPGRDDGADFKLVYHFHGTYSEHFEREAPGVPKKRWVGWKRLIQTTEAAAELQKKSASNVAIVYPISAGKRLEPEHRGWSNKMYDRMWMDPAKPPKYADEFDKLHEEVLAVLQSEFKVHEGRLRGRVIAEGHSAGGIALYNIAAHGSRHVGEYIFLDAAFQGWGDGCYDAVQESKSGALVTLVITKNGMTDPLGKWDPWCLDLEADAAAWEPVKARCAGRPQRAVPGSRRKCGELETAAQMWPDYTKWCAGMKVEMKDTPGIFVHRTSVGHGDQVRRFTGGLDLPDSRYDKVK